MRRPFLPPRQNSRVVAFSLAFSLAFSGIFLSAASAADCAPSPAISACFDANALWLPAGRAHFISMPDPRVIGVHQLSVGVESEVLHRPVQLHAPSPDAEGRTIRALDFAVDASYFMTFGLLEHLELTVAAPVRAYQTGAGLGGINAQTSPTIERNAARNPRIGFGYSLPAPTQAKFGLRLGMEASLPLGESDAFGGERSVVAAPGLTLGYHRGALRAGASLGARLRSPVQIGNTQLGNQAFVALGAGAELLGQGRLFVSLEAFALPALSSSRSAGANSTFSDARLVPAEWLAAVQTSVGVSTLSVGAGSGIPLSSETSEGRTSHFFGLTTPDFRALVLLRIAPNADD